MAKPAKSRTYHTRVSRGETILIKSEKRDTIRVRSRHGISITRVKPDARDGSQMGIQSEDQAGQNLEATAK